MDIAGSTRTARAAMRSALAERVEARFPAALHITTDVPEDVEEGGQFAQAPTLLFLLSGAVQVQTAYHSRRNCVSLDRQSALFAAQHSWRHRRTLRPSRLMALIFYNDTTRLVIADSKRPRQLDAWHTPDPLGANGRRILQVLGALAHEPSGRPGMPGLVPLLLSYVLDDLTETTPAQQGRARTTFLALRAYLHDHFHEPECNRATAAQASGLNPSYLSRLFSQESDLPFNTYLTRLRLTHAEHLLRTTRLPVKTIARRCGYSDPDYFGRQFARQAGCPPSHLRARAIAAPSPFGEPGGSV